MSSHAPHDDRRLDLQCEQALAGLAPDDAAELRALGGATQPFDDLELAAAALDLALFPPQSQELPSRLRQRILAAAPGQPGQRLVAVPPVPRAHASGRWGWMAAAVLLVAAAAGWWPRLAERGLNSPAGRMARLERADPQVLRLGWAGAPDPAGKDATGGVVWSSTRQEGFLRIAGLAANDPKVEQYQLWIFDADRPAETPVDGGVFDLAEGGGIVPIRAKLPVGKATLFAVTVEKPGGVVVSRRERIVLLAKSTS